MRSEFYLLQALASLGVVAVAATHLPRAAAPVQVPITGQGIAPDGRKITISGVAVVTVDDAAPPPIPTPTPDPISILRVGLNPSSVMAGQASTGTVTLNRAPAQPIQVTLKALDKGLLIAPSVTINVGQTSGTFAVGTPATQATAFWYSLSASYNGQSQSASLLVGPPPPPTPTPLPVPPVPVPPEPLGAVSPQVDGLSNPDGSPLTLPLVPGQPVRVFGARFGAAAGELWGNGYPLPVVSWSDTEAVGRLSWSCAAISVGVRTKAGGYYEGGAPDEPWAEAPGPEPPSNRRR